MSAVQTKPVVLHGCRCILHSTSFSGAGEFITRDTKPFNKDTYAIRHVVTKGGVHAVLNGSQEPIPVGDVWPKDKDYDVNTFQIVADADGAEYYCVVPVNDVELSESTTLHDSGETFTVPLRSIAFLFGGEFEVAGVRYSGTKVLAADTSEFTVTCFSSVKAVVITPEDLEFVYEEVFE